MVKQTRHEDEHPDRNHEPETSTDFGIETPGAVIKHMRASGKPPTHSPVSDSSRAESVDEDLDDELLVDSDDLEDELEDDEFSDDELPSEPDEEALQEIEEESKLPSLAEDLEPAHLDAGAAGMIDASNDPVRMYLREIGVYRC